MTVRLAKTAGFCFGVDRAVQLVYALLEKGEKVCTLGPIIHNPQLVADLAARGVKIIDDVAEAPEGYTVIVRTHGVPKDVMDALAGRKIKYANATCPFVQKIHRIVQNQPDGTAVLIAGDEKHPEVQGIRSYCGASSFVFKNAQELENILKNNNLADSAHLICVSQTTFSKKEWENCKKFLKKVCLYIPF